MKFIMSLFLGMLPEILFITLFLIYSKNLKEKKIRLFLLIGLAYLLCIISTKFKILLYTAFVFVGYLILKLLYKDKTQIIDIFLFGISNLYLASTSFICFCFVKPDFSNYFILLAISRLLLFVPFIFKNKLNNWYKKYYKLWNRNDGVKRPIKSITLRNISIILLNIFVFFINYCIIICSNYI